MTWREVLQSSRARWAMAFCLVVLLMMVFYLPVYFGEIIGPKKGFLLEDSFLHLLEPVDWSLTIFIILYIAVIQTFVSYVKKPDLLIVGLTTYCLMNLIRMLTLYVVTLEPPPGMMLLTDPISSIAYPDRGFAKDLFFSGHVSTMMVLVFIEKKRILKYLKVVAAIVVAFLLAWQHVHYTVDLLAAPPITYGIFRLTQANLKRL